MRITALHSCTGLWTCIYDGVPNKCGNSLVVSYSVVFTLYSNNCVKMSLFMKEWMILFYRCGLEFDEAAVCNVGSLLYWRKDGGLACMLSSFLFFLHFFSKQQSKHSKPWWHSPFWTIIAKQNEPLPQMTQVHSEEWPEVKECKSHITIVDSPGCASVLVQ